MSIEPTGGRPTAHDIPAEPEHPMMLLGDMVAGDAALMARCMIEELLQVGLSPAELAAMTRDPNYQGLYHARRTLGDRSMDALLARTCARIGAHHHHTVEHGGDVQSATLTISASRPAGA